ncbi:phage tail protein [Vibrio tetraodonis]|nr:phage tail protein [Vibrio tetraodonis]
MNDESLLPDNRTSLDVTIERTLRTMLKSEDVYSWLRDPDRTREDLLDIMAREEGVQDWYDSDRDSDKRNSVKNSTRIRRKAGTLTGVKEALEALGCRAQVERSGKYALYIYNLITDKPLTPDLQSRLYERVLNNKSERDSFELVIGRLWQGARYKSGQISIARRIKVKGA